MDSAWKLFSWETGKLTLRSTTATIVWILWASGPVVKSGLGAQNNRP